MNGCRRWIQTSEFLLERTAAQVRADGDPLPNSSSVPHGTVQCSTDEAHTVQASEGIVACEYKLVIFMSVWTRYTQLRPQKA